MIDDQYKNKKVNIQYGILEDREVDPDFTEGDYTVERNYLGETPRNIRTLVIHKSEKLTPENIRENVNVCGVKGTLKAYVPYEKTVELDMSKGDQIIDCQGETEAHYPHTVNIRKPETLIPENIKLSVNIGGVVGSYRSEEYPDEVLQTKTVRPSIEQDVVVLPDAGKYLSEVTVSSIMASMGSGSQGSNRPLGYMTEAFLQGYTIGDVAGTYAQGNVTRLELDSSATDETIKKVLEAHKESYYLIDASYINTEIALKLKFKHECIYKMSGGVVYEYKIVQG